MTKYLLKKAHSRRPIREYSNIEVALVGKIHQDETESYAVFEFDGGKHRLRFQQQDLIASTGISVGKSMSQVRDEKDTSRKINERFRVLDDLLISVINKNVPSLIIAGAPGIGKSSTVYQKFDEMYVSYMDVKGSVVSAYQLYQTLYQNQSEDKVIIFDDSDDILFDQGCLNLLKAALDTGGNRKVSYQSKAIENQGMLTSFDFKGSVIFITNLNFQKIIDNENRDLGKHLAAITDRSIYLDLLLHDRFEVRCRINDVMYKVLKDYHLSDQQYDDVRSYLKQHQDDFRQLSLRTVRNIASFMKDHLDWRRMADATLLRKK